MAQITSGAETTGRPGNRTDEQYIRSLFDGIARHYDLMNMIMSMGMLRRWQKRFQSLTGLQPGQRALDVGCGTGELSLIMARQTAPDGKVEGIDLSEGMIAVGRRKVEKAGLSDRITMRIGNALDLPFDDGTFHCVATGFTMRNVNNLVGAINEMARVTRPGGRVVCLELSRPVNPILRRLYYFYFYRIVPLLGRWNERRFAARHRGHMPPYKWLPESLRRFPHQEEMARLFTEAGLEQVEYYNLTGGIVCLHVGVKGESRP